MHFAYVPVYPTWQLSFKNIKATERLFGRLKNDKFNAQYFGLTGLTFLRGYTEAKNVFFLFQFI